MPSEVSQADIEQAMEFVLNRTPFRMSASPVHETCVLHSGLAIAVTEARNASFKYQGPADACTKDTVLPYVRQLVKHGAAFSLRVSRNGAGHALTFCLQSKLAEHRPNPPLADPASVANPAKGAATTP